VWVWTCIDTALYEADFERRPLNEGCVFFLHDLSVDAARGLRRRVSGFTKFQETLYGKQNVKPGGGGIVAGEVVICRSRTLS